MQCETFFINLFVFTRVLPEIQASEETRKFCGTRQCAVDISRRTIYQNKIRKNGKIS